ncbi:MAG: aspartate kinase [Phycisphaerales bacterium]
MRVEVHKFGGTSVLGAARMRCVADLVIEASARNATAGGTGIVVVASAMSGVTNVLVEATAHAKAGRRDKAAECLAKIRTAHEQALAEVEGASGPVRTEITRILDDLQNVLRGAELVGEVTARTRDRIVSTGEKLSVRIIALILRQRGRDAQAIDADTFIDTDATYSDANPLPFVTDRGIESFLRPRLDRGQIPVVTGFMGRAPDGSTTTFSRGGSDFTATLLAGALNADEVTIWTDVDGVFTTDPRIVPGAALIGQLNYREAGEMSYYGAKVLHQRTMIPVAGKRIPVWVRNTLNPSARGSVVDGTSPDRADAAHPVKAVTAVKDQALLSLEGKGMSGVPGVSGRLFSCLAARGISVTMISQSSSESSVCLAVPGPDALEAEAAIKREFRADIARGDIEDVTVRGGVALVAAVGLGMAHTPGVAGSLFSALGESRVNVLAIAQGSSELNITLAVEEAETAAAIAAIHDRFALDGGGVTPRGRKTCDLLIMGCGQVGRALIDLVRKRGAGAPRVDLPERLRIVGVADRGAYLLKTGGLTPNQLDGLLAAKSSGKSLSTVEGATAAKTSGGGPAEMLAAAEELHLASPVVVDVSDSDASAPLLERALRRRMDAVTANKRPIADSWPDFVRLRDASRQTGRTLRVEATVGAGLPVIDTLAMLLATGDSVTRIEGCFSGTLGFVTTALQDGAAFSDAVGEAIKLGYTEPDPVTDLCGADVARKAVILARLSGISTSDEPAALTGLVDRSLAGMERERLMQEIKKLDAPMAARVKTAKERGLVLRFVAKVERGSIVVGPAEVPLDSPIGALRGTDNIFVFHTACYDPRPLVVSGRGAGAVGTAMGVLADILRLRTEGAVR